MINIQNQPGFDFFIYDFFFNMFCLLLVKKMDKSYENNFKYLQQSILCSVPVYGHELEFKGGASSFRIEKVHDFFIKKNPKQTKQIRCFIFR